MSSLLLSALHLYLSAHPDDSLIGERFATLIDQYGDAAYGNQHWDGHITASMLITNPEKTRVLLMFHKKYQIWTHFGGHCDGEIDTRSVAIREFHEESGIIGEPEMIGDIFGVQVWDIAERTSSSGMFQPAHKHYDILYLGIIPEDTPFARQEDEVDDIRWFDIVGIEEYIQEDRMLQMCRRIADTHPGQK